MGGHGANVVSVEEATVVRTVRVVPSISRVGATGGSPLVKGNDEEEYLSGVLSGQPRARPTWPEYQTVSGAMDRVSWKVRKTVQMEADQRQIQEGLVGGICRNSKSLMPDLGENEKE